MLVKCAVQVNQCYEEINLTQFLLLMNFSISCELLSVVCAGQAEQPQQQLCCLSHISLCPRVKRAQGARFVESCVPWPWIRTWVLVWWMCRCVWAELECEHPTVRQAEPGTVTAAQGLCLTVLPWI